MTSKERGYSTVLRKGRKRSLREEEGVVRSVGRAQREHASRSRPAVQVSSAGSAVRGSAGAVFNPEGCLTKPRVRALARHPGRTYLRPFRNSGDSLLELPLHLPGLGKAAQRLLREDQLAAVGDLEDAVRALLQSRGDAEALLQLVRQTGGTGVVVSDHTVFDVDVGHGMSILRSALHGVEPDGVRLGHRRAIVDKIRRPGKPETRRTPSARS